MQLSTFQGDEPAALEGFFCASHQAPSGFRSHFGSQKLECKNIYRFSLKTTGEKWQNLYPCEVRILTFQLTWGFRLDSPPSQHALPTVGCLPAKVSTFCKSGWVHTKHKHFSYIYHVSYVISYMCTPLPYTIHAYHLHHTQHVAHFGSYLRILQETGSMPFYFWAFSMPNWIGICLQIYPGIFVYSPSISPSLVPGCDLTIFYTWTSWTQTRKAKTSTRTSTCRFHLGLRMSRYKLGSQPSPELSTKNKSRLNQSGWDF